MPQPANRRWSSEGSCPSITSSLLALVLFSYSTFVFNTANCKAVNAHWYLTSMLPHPTDVRPIMPPALDCALCCSRTNYAGIWQASPV